MSEEESSPPPMRMIDRLRAKRAELAAAATTPDMRETPKPENVLERLRAKRAAIMAERQAPASAPEPASAPSPKPESAETESKKETNTKEAKKALGHLFYRRVGGEDIKPYKKATKGDYIYLYFDASSPSISGYYDDDENSLKRLAGKTISNKDKTKQITLKGNNIIFKYKKGVGLDAYSKGEDDPIRQAEDFGAVLMR